MSDLFAAYLYVLAASMVDDRRLPHRVGWPRAAAWVWVAVVVRWLWHRIPDADDPQHSDRSPR